jgi:MarR family 2-MHQ and catechol resistance regulon transcriptional repressor
MLDIGYIKGQNSFVMDKSSRDPVHCWLVLVKAFQAASKYLYAGLEETGIDDTDFRILEALLNKGPLPVKYDRPKSVSDPRFDQCGHRPPVG